MANKISFKSAPPITSKVSPSSIQSSSSLRGIGSPPFGMQLAQDLDGLSSAVNALYTALSKYAPSATQLVLHDSGGNVVAAFGDFTFGGKRYTNYMQELHLGDPLQTEDPSQAVLNSNADGSMSIGGSGWIDILDGFGTQVGWLGARNDFLSVTGAFDNGSGLIRLTVPGHTLVAGDTALVTRVGGVPNATGTWVVAVVNSGTIDLDASTFDGAYAGGGFIDRVIHVSGAVDNGSGLIRIHTAVAHGYSTGDTVDVRNVGGIPNSNGQWTVTVIDSTHIDLQGSTFAGSFGAGGTCLRFFSGFHSNSGFSGVITGISGTSKITVTDGAITGFTP